MNAKDIIFDINKKVKNEFLIYIENEFSISFEIIKTTGLKNMKKEINNQMYYEYILTFFKRNLLLEVDKGFYDDTKKELYKFISNNYNNVFEDKQLEFITNKLLNFYYPYIKQIFIKYINSI